MTYPRYYLTDDQKAFARYQAKLRNDAKPLSIRHKTTRGNHTSEDAHLVGIAPEIVYGYITGQEIDTSIHAHGDMFDFTNKFNHEIRGSTWKGPDIEMKIKMEEFLKKIADVYTLARVSPDISYVEFIGCITREKFDKVKYIRNHGYGNNYCVGPDQLAKGLPVTLDNQLKYISFDMVDNIIKSKKSTATPFLSYI